MRLIVLALCVAIAFPAVAQRYRVPHRRPSPPPVVPNVPPLYLGRTLLSVPNPQPSPMPDVPLPAPIVPRPLPPPPPPFSQIAPSPFALLRQVPWCTQSVVDQCREPAANKRTRRRPIASGR